MVRLPSPKHQPDVIRKPDNKPADFRANSQKQSNAGTYDDRGNDRLKKVLIWVIVVAVAAVIITIVVDAVAGREIS